MGPLSGCPHLHMFNSTACTVHVHHLIPRACSKPWTIAASHVQSTNFNMSDPDTFSPRILLTSQHPPSCLPLAHLHLLVASPLSPGLRQHLPDWVRLCTLGHLLTTWNRHEVVKHSNVVAFVSLEVVVSQQWYWRCLCASSREVPPVSSVLLVLLHLPLRLHFSYCFSILRRGRHPRPFRHAFLSCLILSLPSAVLISSSSIRVLHISSCACWHPGVYPNCTERHHRYWSCLRPVDGFAVNQLRSGLQFETRPRWRSSHTHRRFCVPLSISVGTAHNDFTATSRRVPLVVPRHGLEQCLFTEIKHVFVCGRRACLLRRRPAILIIRESVEDGYHVVHHERHHGGRSILSFA